VATRPIGDPGGPFNFRLFWEWCALPPVSPPGRPVLPLEKLPSPDVVNRKVQLFTHRLQILHDLLA
jgi:hypothetical protein